MIEEGKCNAGMESLCQHITCVRKSLPNPGHNMWTLTVINDNEWEASYKCLLGLLISEE